MTNKEAREHINRLIETCEHNKKLREALIKASKALRDLDEKEPEMPNIRAANCTTDVQEACAVGFFEGYKRGVNATEKKTER